MGFMEGCRGPLVRDRSRPRRRADEGVIISEQPLKSNKQCSRQFELASQCVVSLKAVAAGPFDLVLTLGLRDPGEVSRRAVYEDIAKPLGMFDPLLEGFD